MQLRKDLFLLVAMLFLCNLVGCAKTYSFDISVTNQTPEPIVVWLTKDGPPAEKEWLSPEQVAFSSPAGDDRRNWEPIPPGKTVGTLVKGTFDRETRAFLRIYQGVATLDEVLATSRGSAGRLDLPLKPGKNTFVIGRENNRLVAK
jgi:hypothetical protein